MALHDPQPATHTPSTDHVDSAGEGCTNVEASGQGDADRAAAEGLDLLTTGLQRITDADPSDLSEDRLADTIAQLGAIGGRIEGLQARLVATAQSLLLPERSGAGSTAAWVADQTGRSRTQAARTSRLADAADTTPELADAVAAGTLGPDHADTLAGGLDRGELEPDDLDQLLGAARTQTPEQLRRTTRQLTGQRRQDRLRNAELVAHDARTHTHWRTADGSLRYEGQLAPAIGDLLETALAGFYQPDTADTPDGDRRTHQQRSADAFAEVLHTALKAGEAGDIGGEAPHINVVVPIEAMAALHDAQDAGVTAVTDHGTVLTMDAFGKLACDARVRRVVIGPGSEPVDIGRAQRQWPAPMRAAIMATDGGCRGPDCDLPPHRCIVHHLTWWSNNGDTSIANGAPLCLRHHDLVHDHGWTLTMDPTSRICTWTSPDHTTTRTTRPRGHRAPVEPAVEGVQPPGLPDFETELPGLLEAEEPDLGPVRGTRPPPTPNDRPRGRGDPIGPAPDNPADNPGQPARTADPGDASGASDPRTTTNRAERHDGRDPPASARFTPTQLDL